MREATIIGELNIGNKPYDILIIAGQSNAEGHGRSFITNILPGYTPNSNIKMVRRFYDVKYEEIDKAFYPIISLEDKYIYKDAKPYMLGRYGFYLYFSKLYKKAMLSKGRKLLILHTAIGGSSFVHGQWGKGEMLSENAINMAQEVLKINSENRIIGVLWHQGESDVLAKVTEEFYYEKLKEMVLNFRERLNMPDLLFVFGDLQEEWKKSQETAVNISNATQRVVTELIKTEFVVSDGLKGNSKSDVIHFSRKSQIELGRRYFSKFSSTEKVKIMFLGDSITENGQFISIINTYLGIKGEDKNVDLYNLGVSSENVSGLTEKGHPYPRPYLFNRLTNAMNEATPDVVFVMYGVNDAILRPFSEENFSLYKEGILRVISELKSRNIEPVICTPTIFDLPSCTNAIAEKAAECQFGFIYKEYDLVMKKYSEWILNDVSKLCMTIDIRSAIHNFIASRRKNNNSYSSGDGIHYNYEVNVAMAVAILRGYFGSDISVNRLVESGEFRKLFKFMYARDNIVHKYYKERVGHDLPYKENAPSYKRVVKRCSMLNLRFHNAIKFFCYDPLLEKKYNKILQKVKDAKVNLAKSDTVVDDKITPDGKDE